MLTARQQEIYALFNELQSQQKVANQLGISRRTVRKSLAAVNAKMLYSPTGFYPVKVTSDGKGTPVSVVHKPIPAETGKPEGKVVRRSTLYNADGSVANEWIIRQPVPEVDDTTLRDIIESMKDEIPREPRSEYYQPAKNKRMALVNIVDDHMNMRSYKEEIGEDWTIEKAYNLYLNKFQELIENMPSADMITIANLGDQFHDNDHMKVTPAHKNLLDTDVPFHVAVSMVIRLNRERIRIAKAKFGKVKYIVVQGNHDVDAIIALYEVLNVAFENDENVTIEFAEGGIHASTFGKTMLVFDHGNNAKPDQLAGYAASNYSTLYGETEHRYIHTGHVHNEQVKDTLCGFLWHSHRTLSPLDKFGNRSRFHTPRSIKGYVYDADCGEIFSIRCNIH